MIDTLQVTQMIGFSPGVRGKVILHSPAIPHRADAIGAVRAVVAVLLLDSLLVETYRVKSQRTSVRGRTVALSH